MPRQNRNRFEPSLEVPVSTEAPPKEEITAAPPEPEPIQPSGDVKPPKRGMIKPFSDGMARAVSHDSGVRAKRAARRQEKAPAFKASKTPILEQTVAEETALADISDADSHGIFVPTPPTSGRTIGLDRQREIKLRYADTSTSGSVGGGTSSRESSSEFGRKDAHAQNRLIPKGFFSRSFRGLRDSAQEGKKRPVSAFSNPVDTGDDGSTSTGIHSDTGGGRRRRQSFFTAITAPSATPTPEAGGRRLYKMDSSRRMVLDPIDLMAERKVDRNIKSNLQESLEFPSSDEMRTRPKPATVEEAARAATVLRERQVGA